MHYKFAMSQTYACAKKGKYIPKQAHHKSEPHGRPVAVVDERRENPLGSAQGPRMTSGKMMAKKPSTCQIRMKASNLGKKLLTAVLMNSEKLMRAQ